MKNLIIVEAFFVVLFVAINYIYKKSFKNPPETVDLQKLRFYEYAKFKMRLAKKVFLFGIFLYLLVIVLKFFDF